MSLEDQLAKLTAAVEKQNALTEQLLTKVPAASGGETKPASTKATAADKPAAETKPAADKPADTIAIGDFMAKIEPWIKDFAKGTDEGDARRAKLAEVLKKLGVAKVSEITDPVKLGKIDTWFETKMRTFDEGHGIGRLTGEKAEAAADEEL